MKGKVVSWDGRCGYVVLFSNREFPPQSFFAHVSAVTSGEIRKGDDCEVWLSEFDGRDGLPLVGAIKVWEGHS